MVKLESVACLGVEADERNPQMTDRTYAPVPTAPMPDRKTLRKSVVAGSIGVFVHWLDWAIYAYMAGVIAQVFFPTGDQTAGLLAVFGVFAVSFFVRPLGAIIFGRLGDTMGRKKTLSIVILLMAASTLMLGILPGYGTVGILAPILLIVVRVIQGIAAGGEFGSAAAFLAEYSPPKKRGFGVSWLEFGSLLGFLFASLIVFVLTSSMSAEAIANGGWRIAFLITVPFGIVGLYIRTKIEDTPEFTELARLNNVAQSPVAEVFRKNWKQLIQTCGIEIFMNVTFYVVLVYLLTYQETVVGVEASQAVLFTTLASALSLIVVPFSGLASDRWGRKPVLMTAAIALTVLSLPLFLVMQSGQPWATFVSTMGLALILAIILGTHAVTVAELFPTRTRQTGLSIAYAVTAALFAGTAPFLLTLLIDVTKNDLVPGFFLIAVGVVGIITVASLKESKGIDLLMPQDLERTVAK